MFFDQIMKCLQNTKKCFFSHLLVQLDLFPKQIANSLFKKPALLGAQAREFGSTDPKTTSNDTTQPLTTIKHGKHPIEGRIGKKYI